MKIISTEYPYFPQHPTVVGKAAVLVVLTQDDTGRYAAYIGNARDPNALEENQRVGDAHWVAQRGSKLSFADAVPKYFVGIREDQYRA